MKVISIPAAILRKPSAYIQNAWRARSMRRWKPYSRLFIVADGARWVIDWEVREVDRLARNLGIDTILEMDRLDAARRQSVFFAAVSILFARRRWPRGMRVATSYFHGRPGMGDPVFEERFETFKRCHERIDRLQVTNREFRDVILTSGIDSKKIHLIPIGIHLSFFPRQTSESKRLAREELGVPHSAVVVGSFQKDGNGWGEGMEPKRVKGPDVFLKTIEALAVDVPELFVLLSGPARGYVRAGLDKMGIPHRHLLLDDYPQVARLYQCLDAYIVSSREEGGPKAVLESFASGVPLVSTRVGQATDLVVHGENGWLADVEDSEALAHWTLRALDKGERLETILANARRTAEENSYDAQTPLWRDFMRGFVETT